MENCEQKLDLLLLWETRLDRRTLSALEDEMRGIPE